MPKTRAPLYDCLSLSCHDMPSLKLGWVTDIEDHSVNTPGSDEYCSVNTHTPAIYTTRQSWSVNCSAFSFTVNHQRSKPADLADGATQGSVFGPYLLLLCILPLGEIIQQFNHIFYLFFTDELQLYCSFRALEEHKYMSLVSFLTSLKQ